MSSLLPDANEHPAAGDDGARVEPHAHSASPSEPGPSPEQPAQAADSQPETPCPIRVLGVVAAVSTADAATATRLARSLARPPGSRLIHVHADARHGRTVMTALGEPGAVLDALVDLGRRIGEEIDLRKHHGVHPRVGALDAVTLVPLSPRLPALEAAGLARALAERLARESGLATVLHGAADPASRSLPDLRAGGVAGLLARVEKGEVTAWKPDHDTRERRARTGFACVGAGEPTVTLAVELATGEVGHARRIAQRIADGPDPLPCVRAMGFRLSDARTQVFLELLDPERTGVLAAFSKVARLAEEARIPVIGSEIVGCVPRSAWPEGAAERILEKDLAGDAEGRRVLESWLAGGPHADEPGLLAPGAEADASAEAEGEGETTAVGNETEGRRAGREPHDARIRPLDLPLAEARAALQGLVAELGERSFRANQVLHGIYGRRVRDLEGMTDLPKAFREELAKRVRIGLLDLVERADSSDGTVKYLWRLADGGEIESVAIPADRRTTFCVSSQVGCALKCGFCATGTLGLARNLTQGEMVDQVLAMLADGRQAQESLNVVFMGMGEPGYNMDAVLGAVRTLNDPEGLGIGARHVTISTAGVVPAIERLAEEPLQVRLAVSLHAGDQALRERLMNVAERHPLDQLLAACKAYHDATGRHVTFECAVIPGVNDRPEDARSLARFASEMGSKVNLIPYNPVAGFDAPAASEADVARFRDELARTYRGEIMIRQTRGRDIEAACGMLHRARRAVEA